MDINQTISLGIGTPAGIPEFLTFGLQIGDVVAGATPGRAFDVMKETRRFSAVEEVRRFGASKEIRRFSVLDGDR